MLDIFRKQKSPEQKSQNALLALWQGGQANWSTRDYSTLAREGVMQNAVTYRCVRMIAEGQGPLGTGGGKGGTPA